MLSEPHASAESLAVAGCAYDGVVVAQTEPPGTGQLVNFASDGIAACAFARTDGTVVLGPSVPLTELVASLCLDVGGSDEDVDGEGIVLDEGTLAALNALFGRGQAEVPVGQATAALAAALGGCEPDDLIRILAEENLVVVDGDTVRAGSLTRETPALAAYVSGHRLDVHRVHLASGGTGRQRRALFCGPPGERFALLKGANPSSVSIARMRASDLSLALAAVVGGATGLEASVVNRALHGERVPSGDGPWVLGDLAAFDAVPDDVADVIDRPAWALTAEVDDARGRATLGVSAAEGVAVAWSATADGLALKSVDLSAVPDQVADIVLPDGVHPGQEVPAAAATDVLRELPEGNPGSRRRARVVVTAREADVIRTWSCLLLDRGADGAWFIDTDSATADAWSPEPATRSVLTTWLRTCLEVQRT